MKSNNQVKSVKSTVAIASRSILFASLGMAGLLTSSSAHADATWGCTAGNWESTNCWNTSTIPGSNDNVYVNPVSGADTTLYFSNTAGTQSVNNILIDSTTVNNALFTQSGGTLSSGYEFIGIGGTGTFTQSGGTNTVSNTLDLGFYSGSSGAYNLSSTGSLSAGNSEDIGYYGTGTFTQSGGTNTVR